MEEILMSNNNFTLSIIASLNKQLSAKSIKGDLKSLDNKFYVKVLAKLTKTLATKELQNQLKQLNNLYVQVGANVKVDKNAKSKLEQNIKMLQSQISDLEIGLSASKIQQAKLNSDINGIRKRLRSKINSEPLEFNMELKKNKLIADIEYLGKRYSKLFSNISASRKYESIMQNAISVSDKGQLADIRTELAAFTSELKANGLAGKSTGDRWAGLIDRAKDLFSAASIVRVIFKQMRQAISSTLELDTAMTDLYKVQNDVTSREQFSGMLTKWNKLAQELSVTTESLINSASEWSKIGFDLDMSEQLAQITTIFEKTAEISNEQASKTLISGAQAFTEIDDLGEEDYVKRVEAIGNKINAIGNKYAISSEGISEALQNSSAALKMANNDLDESIALITTGNKIFQSAEEMGNTLKVVSARLRGQKGELEALNEDTEGMIEGVSKVQTQILNLTKNKVNIFESDNETLKSTYDIMLEVGKVLDSLSDKDSASLLEIMFGKQRMSVGSSLLLNYEELEKVKNDSMNAANSMAEEYAKYMESAEAHITTFKEKLVETYQSFMNGDTIKYAADFGTAMLDILNKTDLLRHGLLAIASIKLSQGISTIGLSIADAAKQINTLGSAIQKVKNLPLDEGLKKEVLEKVGLETKNLTDKNLKLLLSQKQLLDNDKIQILSRHNLTKEEAEAKLIKMGLISATNAQTTANKASTTSTFTLSGAMTALKASAIGAWQAIKTVFWSNPIGFVLTGVTTAFSILSTFISGHNQKLEEANQKAKEAAEASAEQSNKLSTLLIQYNELSNAVKSNLGSKEDLLSVQSELLEALGVEEAQLQRLVEKYGDLDTAINQVTLDALQRAKGDLLVNVDIAREELLKTGHKSKIFNDDLYIDNNYSDIVEKIKTLSVDGLDIRYGGNADELVYLKTLGDTSTEEGIMANYNAMIQLRQGLEELYAAEGKTEELGSLDFYKALNGEIKALSDSYESYDSAIEKYNDNVGMTLILTSLSGKEIPKSKEEFESLQEQLIQAALVSGKFIGSQEDIKDSIINALAEMPEFTQYFEEFKTGIKEFNDETLLSFQYDKLEDIPQKLSEVESAYKTAQSALEEYNKNGYNSMSTIDSILSLEDEYINVLVDENGQLQLNAETMNQLAAIKIETAKAAIYQETCEELVRIKTLDTALAAQELALVNGTLTESAYETAKALYVEVTAMGGANALLADKLWSATTKKITLLDNQLANLNNGNCSVGVSVNADTKKAETDWKKFLDNELNLARANFDAGLTDFNTYMSKRKDFLDKYLAQDKISYDDYWDYIKKGYEEQKKFYDSVLSAVTRRLDREIDSNQDIIDGLEKQNDALEKQKDNYDKIVSAVLDTIDAKKEEMQSSIDALEKENNAIGKQVDEYDSVISAIQNVYEEKQDALKAEQDAIQERIDALRDENDEHKRAIELQKARYELERSMNQRSKMVYNGEQFVYMADSQEVKENREKLADLELENTIASMEKEKETLQELIDELDHYKNMWADITDSYQKAKDADIARNILGENYEEDILLNRIEDIEAFKDRYMEAQSKIDDNTSLIESYEEKAGYYDGLKKKWEELSSVHEININKQLASERFGAGWEILILEDRLAGFDEFRKDYLSIQGSIDDNTSMIESYNEKTGYYQKLKNEWSAVADVYEDSVNTQHAAMLLGQNWETDILSGRITTLNQFKNDYVKIQEAIAQADVDRYNKQVEAVQNAKNEKYTGNASIGNGGNITGNYSGNISGGKDDSFDDVNHYRIVDSKTGKVYIDGIESRQNADQWIGRQEESGRYTGSIIGRMKVEKYTRGGVISGDSSGYLDWIAELCKEDHIVAVSNNERVLTPEQNKSFEKIVDTIPSLIANTYNPKMTPGFDIREFNQTQTSQPVSFTMGDIHLHNVQNVDGLAKAIELSFPNTMLRRAFRRR